MMLSDFSALLMLDMIGAIALVAGAIALWHRAIRERNMERF
jgi:hypothetical protein